MKYTIKIIGFDRFCHSFFMCPAVWIIHVEAIAGAKYSRTVPGSVESWRMAGKMTGDGMAPVFVGRK
jgi:hypothetical protein